MTDRHQIYRENNRELLREKAREYYEANKEAQRQRGRDYQKAHAEQIGERVLCECCGRCLTRGSIKRHQKSAICQRYRDPEYVKRVKGSRCGCELGCGRDIYECEKKKHQATKYCQKHRKRDPLLKDD